MTVASLPAPITNDDVRYEVRRCRLTDGAETTVYVLRYPATSTTLRIAHLEPPGSLDRWCAERGIEEAMSGGFFVLPDGPALGDLWIEGRKLATVPFLKPYGALRGSVMSDGEGQIRIGSRRALPRRPRAHLLQAGPLLVVDGERVHLRDDPEGFTAGASQFDSDISAGRHPRAAFGLTDEELLAVVSDGRRSGLDAGLTLDELADLMVELGTRDALNLDGGGSATLVHRGHLVNRVYGDQDLPLREPRPVCSALVFESTIARARGPHPRPGAQQGDHSPRRAPSEALHQPAA